MARPKFGCLKYFRSREKAKAKIILLPEGFRGFILNHDKAPSHTTKLTVDFLKKEYVTLLGHPLCSPGFILGATFSSPKIKHMLKSTRFWSPDEAVPAYLEAVQALSTESGKMYL